VSCETDLNLDYLIHQMWFYLDLIRVYTKRRGEYPDFEGGLILKNGVTVEQVCLGIHKSLVEEFKVY
jgi:ribosome-interacting GTPase 1